MESSEEDDDFPSIESITPQSKIDSIYQSHTEKVYVHFFPFILVAIWVCVALSSVCKKLLLFLMSWRKIFSLYLGFSQLQVRADCCCLLSKDALCMIGLSRFYFQCIGVGRFQLLCLECNAGNGQKVSSYGNLLVCLN